MRNPEGTKILRVKGSVGMKKWCVISGILVVLLTIGLVSCVPVPVGRPGLEDEVDRLEGELSDTKAELSDARGEVRAKEDELSDVRGELEKVSAQLSQLRATQRLSFGEGLKVFAVSYHAESLFSTWVEGKVQNVSDAAMETVKVLVVSWAEDGTLEDVSVETVNDLFPGEEADWKSWAWEPGQETAIYAFGNR